MENKKMMHKLPVEAYTSKDWFDKEMKSIFSNTWQFAGFIEDISEKGDYITVQAGLNSILIVRGRDHKLRAFHNMCRHRGTQLLRAVGKARKAITCPYHDWTYNLEGELIGIPKQEEEFPQLTKPLHKCGLNLHEASVDIFKGMLFVHPQKNAPSINSYFGPVEPFLGPHLVEELVEYKKEDGSAIYINEIEANWKIIVENYIDHYHLAHLHKGTLQMYDHDKAQFGWAGPHYWFYEPLVALYMDDLDNASPYPLIDSVPRDKVGAYVPWFFPNIGISESESTWSTFHVTPISPSRTRVVVRTKVMNLEEKEFANQYYRSQKSKVWEDIGVSGKYKGDKDDPMASGDFMAEDVYACEQQQKALQSPFFSVGPNAQRGENAVVKFQEIVREWIEGN